MNIKVSIIVPVYKVEKYIGKCIDSLLAQTLPEIEIIVVDDKGGDGSVGIIQQIQQQHQRGDIIQIVEMPHNSGVAAARNVGIKLAKGEYIAFVDSDDWCEASMYEELYHKASKNNSDWCYCEAQKDFATRDSILLRQPYLEVGELTKEKRSFMLTQFVAYFWTGLYKREFLVNKNIFFPEEKFSEDSFFLWMVILQISSFSSVEKPFYHYVVHETSVSNTKDKDKYKTKIKLYNSLLSELKNRKIFEVYQSEIEFLYIKKGFLLPLLNYVIESDNPLSKEIVILFNGLRQQIPNYKKNKYLKKYLVFNLMLFSFQLFPSFMTWFFRLSFVRNRITL